MPHEAKVFKWTLLYVLLVPVQLCPYNCEWNNHISDIGASVEKCPICPNSKEKFENMTTAWGWRLQERHYRKEQEDKQILGYGGWQNHVLPGRQFLFAAHPWGGSVEHSSSAWCLVCRGLLCHKFMLMQDVRKTCISKYLFQRINVK